MRILKKPPIERPLGNGFGKGLVSAASLLCCFWTVFCIAALGGEPATPDGAEPIAGHPQATEALSPELVNQELVNIVQRLDSDSFATRRLASEALRRRLADSSSHTLGQLKAVVEGRSWSLETERALRRLMSQVKAGKEPPRSTGDLDIHDEVDDGLAESTSIEPPGVQAAAALLKIDVDIPAAVAALDARSFRARSEAEFNLRQVVRDPRRVFSAIEPLERMAADDLATSDARGRACGLLFKARGAWLDLPAEQWRFAKVTDAALQVMLNRYLDAKSGIDAENAERALVECLVRDDVRSRLAAEIEQRIVAAEGEESIAKLTRLAEWSRPAMVAEIWSNGVHVTSQYLLVGVPQFPEGGRNPTFFDRCDDKLAHCVQGNNLTFGDWPVGCAFPHPKASPSKPAHDVSYRNTFFFLNNLPTAIARLKYEREATDASAARFLRLSKRTCDQLLTEKAIFSADQAHLLTLLDPNAVADFAVDYLAQCDERVFDFRYNSPLGEDTTHRLLLSHLVRYGRAEHFAPLQELLRNGKLRPAAVDRPYNFIWLALLQIAYRDSSGARDNWLALQVNDETPLYVVDPAQNPTPFGPAPALQPTTVGGTAAAMVLTRHNERINRFDLVAVTVGTVELPGYRFTSAGGVERFKRWYEALRSGEHKSAL